MEQHKVSTDRRNKEVVAYIYICVCVCVCVRVHMCVYIYIHHKKEGNPAIGDNIDEFWDYYARQKKANTIWCNSYTESTKSKLRDIKNRLVVARGGGGGWGKWWRWLKA